jgi:uncharacterized protein YcbX
MLRVSALFLYPVKSLRAVPVDEVSVDELGFAGDRRFLVVDEAGTFLTQRTLPGMARIATELTADSLVLSGEGTAPLPVARTPGPGAPVREVRVWGHSGLLAEDCGDGAADWLAALLGCRCRLVRIGESFRREVTKDAARPGDLVSFADAAPLLVTGEASLAELNRRIVETEGAAVPMDRFRPNLVLSGGDPFAEDDWKSIRIGSVWLRNAGRCDRCVMTTTDQQTGARGREPLRTLATFRRDPEVPGAVFFGTNFIQETKSGTIRVGDAVEVGL